MAPIHTHYDNLRVVRTAPPEIIRAAYKVLSQKYHPDRNADNPDAARVMAIINRSYEILSDAKKRNEHDAWITQQELIITQKSKQQSSPNPAPKRPPSIQPEKSNGIGKLLLRMRGNWILLAWALGIGLAIYFHHFGAPSTVTTNPLTTKSYQASTAPARPKYVRPSVTPSGKPWPVFAGYVSGYRQTNADGLSSVTIDNGQNDSDVFVKLVSIDSTSNYPVRQFYIPAYQQFTLKKVTSGEYDIRYRDLNSGALARSEAFFLEESVTDAGTQFSNLTMTLYKVQNGNMKTFGLTESEF